MDSAKLIIEVVAGLLPGQPMPEYTKRWAVTSFDWDSAVTDQLKRALVVGRATEADEYTWTLRNPSRVNWVRTDWDWV